MSASSDFRAFLPTLRSFCLAFGISVPEEALVACEKHLHVLLKWNRVVNLVGDLSLHSAVERHYGEGLFLATFLPPGTRSVIDIGSGGGFPGAPVAATHPSAAVTLIEARAKKAAFLRESTRDWPNVRVFCGLAADFPEPAEWVCSRAVAADLVLEPTTVRNAGVSLLISSLDVPRVTESFNSLGYSTRSVEIPWRKQAAVFIATPK